MGSDAIAIPMLEDLVGHLRDKVILKGVITQPDRRSGRGMKKQVNPIKDWAEENKITVLQPVKLGSDICEWLRKEDCDLVIVMAYGRILRADLLNTPPLGVLNLHASLLPAYRGASPIPAAIASGDSVTGITLMRVVPELDAGPMMDNEKVNIELNDDVLSLSDKIAAASVPLIRRNLRGLIERNTGLIPQNPKEATYTRLLKKEDGALNFHVSALELVNRIRALKIWPGCFFKFNNQRIKIGRAEADSDNYASGASIVLGEDKGAFCVSAQSGILRMLELQRPGGRMVSAPAFLRGLKIERGTVLPHTKMLPLVSATPFPKIKKATTEPRGN